jgi:putative protein-disulfide isomerase
MLQSPKQKQPPRKQNNNSKEGRIKVKFYTDPLCCWSWALEPHWKKLLQQYGDMISYEYVMGGMIPRWESYNDPLNAVSKPIQMGPVWMHASEITQVKMNHVIWALDPPSSSYPPSIAVKTVGLQSEKASEQYLYIIRKALMEEGLNISKKDILLALAPQLEPDDFDLNLFKDDWEAGRGLESFREDLKKTKYHGVGRFPTITFHDDTGTGTMIIGYRPYDILEQAFLQTKNKTQR